MIAPHLLVFDPSQFIAHLLVNALRIWYKVAPPVCDASQLVAAVMNDSPGVVVLRIPDGCPSVALGLLAKVACNDGTRSIVMGPSESPPLPELCLQAGASGYLLAESDLIELRLAIETVAQGGRYLTPAVRGHSGALRLRPTTPFTSCQRRALHLRQEGKRNTEIAHMIKRDIKSVEKLFCGMRRKLGRVGVVALDWNSVDG